MPLSVPIRHGRPVTAGPGHERVMQLRAAPLLLFGLILGCGFDSVKVSFRTQKNGVLANPERGFHYEAAFMADDLSTRWKKNSNNGIVPDFIAAQDTRFGSAGDGVRLTQLYFYLSAFETSRIAPSAFDSMQKVMDKVREGGHKVILRFAYDYKTTVTIDRVLGHIGQLQPFLARNEGLIHAVEAGFLGQWGEWHLNHYLVTQPGNEEKVLEKLLEVAPADRQVLLRYTPIKRRVSLPDPRKRRLGYHNDYFTAGEHPRARGNDYVTQNFSLNIAHWRDYPLTPAHLRVNRIPFDEGYFVDDQGRAVSRTAYDFIRDHLGYRFSFDFREACVTNGDGTVRLAIAVKNTGFARLCNPRKAYCVLMDPDSRLAGTAELPSHPTD
jgi:hypothetical protein